MLELRIIPISGDFTGTKIRPKGGGKGKPSLRSGPWRRGCGVGALRD